MLGSSDDEVVLLVPRVLPHHPVDLEEDLDWHYPSISKRNNPDVLWKMVIPEST